MWFWRDAELLQRSSLVMRPVDLWDKSFYTALRIDSLPKMSTGGAVFRYRQKTDWASNKPWAPLQGGTGGTCPTQYFYFLTLRLWALHGKNRLQKAFAPPPPLNIRRVAELLQQTPLPSPSPRHGGTALDNIRALLRLAGLTRPA